MRQSKRHRSRRGAAAVEFAVVAIPFFLLVYGSVAMGSLVMVQNVLSGAAADGARMAAVDVQSTDEIIDAVESRLSRGGLNVNDAEITLTPSDPGSVPRGGAVTVRVSMPANLASWLDCGLFLLTFDLSSEVTQIRE